MHRLMIGSGLLALAALLAGCGGDAKVDCAKLGEHVATVSTAGETPQIKEQLYERIRRGEEESCRAGSYSAKESACLLKADSAEAVRACVGLGGAEARKEPAPAPPPPPAPKVPSVAEATATLVALLTPIADGAGVATMHGCAEAPENFADLFRTQKQAAAELRAWMTDATLRGQLEAVVRDRTDPALAAALAKLDAANQGCAEGTAEVQKRLAIWLTPPGA